MVPGEFWSPNSRNVQAKPLDPVGMLLSMAGFGLLLWASSKLPAGRGPRPRSSARWPPPPH
jgi:hypothetical protein